MHDMHAIEGMTITADREEILATLRKNLGSHQAILEEARKGYLEDAISALEKRHTELINGEDVDVQFDIFPPEDHTKVYTTAIKMVELHTAATIQLTAKQVLYLVEDQWDWKHHWLARNSGYSQLARDLL